MFFVFLFGIVVFTCFVRRKSNVEEDNDNNHNNTTINKSNKSINESKGKEEKSNTV